VLEAILGRLREQPSRTGSLIVSLYGDVIVPRGGSLWLGTLLQIFRAAGLRDGVVRTAVSRLAADGWLDRARSGRNSYYRLAERGRSTTEAAAVRIYGPLAPSWQGRFRLALLEPGPDREAAREVLMQAGFGTALPGLLVAPDCVAGPDLPGTLVLCADADASARRRLAERAWPLADVAARYRQFLATFPPDLEGLADHDALVARILMIHHYRRVVLRDPHLPADILPEDWPGDAARQRVARLYATVLPGSERWLDAHAIGEHGPLPPPDPCLRRRFA
jgi:phenylacetic acid degradation operon negative regulatory protein